MNNLTNLNNKEIDLYIKRLKTLKKIRSVFPNFIISDKSITHTFADIDSMTVFDETPVVVEIDLSNAVLTSDFLRKCKYYFSQQFCKLKKLNLNRTTNISDLLGIIFDTRVINKFPSLDRIELVCDSKNNIKNIRNVNKIIEYYQECSHIFSDNNITLITILNNTLYKSYSNFGSFQIIDSNLIVTTNSLIIRSITPDIIDDSDGIDDCDELI